MSLYLSLYRQGSKHLCKKKKNFGKISFGKDTTLLKVLILMSIPFQGYLAQASPSLFVGLR